MPYAEKEDGKVVHRDNVPSFRTLRKPPNPSSLVLANTITVRQVDTKMVSEKERYIKKIRVSMVPAYIVKSQAGIMIGERKKKKNRSWLAVQERKDADRMRRIAPATSRALFRMSVGLRFLSNVRGICIAFFCGLDGYMYRKVEIIITSE